MAHLLKTCTAFLLTTLLLFSLVIPAPLVYATGAEMTINTVPNSNASFLTNLRNFLKREDADRFAQMFTGFVVSGCTHATGAGLTHTPSTCTAYPGGYYSNETGSIVYTNSITQWVIMDKDITGNEGTFTRVAGTHYLLDTTSGATQPSLPSGSIWLMKVVASGGAVTAVSDLRVGNPGILTLLTADLPASCIDNVLVVVTDGTRGLRRCKGNLWIKPTEVSVDEFGAKGDAVFSYAGSATGTDDAVAIQAALDAVVTGGETVRFGCKKYLTAKLTYKGQSMIGCKGPSANDMVGTMVIGKATQDVFYVPDPSTGETGSNYFLPTNTTIKDITVIVDDTTAHTFGTTRPVFPVRGVWTTATVYSRGEWITNSTGNVYVVGGVKSSPSDGGGTSAGSEPTHTAGRVADAGGVVWEYIAPAQLYVGNAAFAFPYDLGTYQPQGVDAGSSGPYRWTWDHVVIGQAAAAGGNNSAGLFTQRSMYANNFVQLTTHKLVYGALFLRPRTLVNGITISSDTMNFSASRLGAVYPLIAFNLVQFTSQSVEYFGEHGPYLLGVSDPIRSGPEGCTFESFYIEQSTPPPTSAPNTIIHGDRHVVTGGNLGSYTNSSWLQWSANNSTVLDSYITETSGSASLKLFGEQNSFHLKVSAGNVTTTVDDRGNGNMVMVTAAAGHAWEADRPKAINGARGGVSSVRSGDFLLRGMGATPFRNEADLWVTPQEMTWGVATAPTVTVDATLESRAYVTLLGNQSNAVDQFHRQRFVVGTDLPAVHARIWIKVRAASGTPTLPITFLSDDGAVSRGTLTPTLSTSWQTFSFDATLEAATAAQFIQVAFNATSTNVNFDVAWIGIELVPPITDIVQFYNAPEHCSADTPSATLVRVRIAKGDWGLSRTAAGAETYNLTCNLPAPTRTTSGRGWKLTSFRIVQQITVATLTSNTFNDLSTITYVNNVANAVADYGGAITITMPTATQANPYLTAGTVGTAAFMNIADAGINLDWTIVMQNTGVYTLYGVSATWTEQQ